MIHQELILNGTRSGAPESIAVLEQPTNDIKDILPQSILETKCNQAAVSVASEPQRSAYSPQPQTPSYLNQR